METRVHNVTEAITKLENKENVLRLVSLDVVIRILKFKSDSWIWIYPDDVKNNSYIIQHW